MKHISNDKISKAIKYIKNYNGFQIYSAIGYLLIGIYDLLKEREVKNND